MPLESATYIDGLVATNPVNATDQVAQGDDHLRLLKSTIKATFPNLTGAMTASQAELNILDGATLSTAELNILDGVTLTAAQINDAARLSAQNIFTATINSFSNDGGPIIRMIDSNAGTNLQNWRIRSTSGELQISSEDNAGSIVQTGFQVSKNAGDGTIGQFTFTADEVQFDVDGSTGFDLNGNFDCSGTVATPNTSASEVGWKGAPPRTISATGNTAATDAGRAIHMTGGSGQTFTLDSDPPADSVVVIANRSGNSWTLAASGTLTLAGVGTGSRTLANTALVSALHIGSGNWYVSGAGIS